MTKIALVFVGIACATTLFVPSANADVPGLGPFTGDWHAHQHRLVINPSGYGRLMYADLSACPPGCSFADAPTATVDFRLASVSNDVATGSVTVTSNPNNDTVGEPVTMKLVTGIGPPFTEQVNGGVVLEVSMGKMRGWNFCNDTTHNYCGG